MGTRSPQAMWCFFRGSDKVRTAVKFQMKQRGIIAKDFSEELGIAPYRLSKYLNDKTPNLNQFQLYKVCDKLGIDVKIIAELR